MIRINKRNEPAAWSRYGNTPGAVYQAIPELRDALLAEQGCICGYCMRQIPVKDMDSYETSRIEHIQCRERYPARELDYSNMVICCPGFINGTEHCDKSKHNQDISFSPFDPNVEISISYSSKDAEIKSSNAIWNNEMNSILYLNNPLLKYNRAEALDGARIILEQRKWHKAELVSKLQEWTNFDQNGQRKAYCGIVIKYLQKKIRQIK